MNLVLKPLLISGDNLSKPDINCKERSCVRVFSAYLCLSGDNGDIGDKFPSMF